MRRLASEEAGLMMRLMRSALLTCLVCVGCGGGGGGDASRVIFPAGGVREADGTMAYCEDYALVSWGSLRFHNDTWGNNAGPYHFAPSDMIPIPDAEHEQCILAREGDAGIEWGWRWDWPLDRGHVKGYAEVHYGMQWYYGHGTSTAPDIPIRIADIDEMTVRWDVDLTAEGIYNLAFDIFLSPDASGTETMHEIMVWVDRNNFGNPSSEQHFLQDVTIDGVTYEFWRHDDFDPYGATRSPDDIPEWTNNFRAFLGPEGRHSDTLDLAAFFDWLVDEGHADPSSWVRVIRFGTEIIEGTGEVWLREYEVTVR